MDATRPLPSLPSRPVRSDTTLFCVFLLVCLWSLILLSCGKRGDPLPPLRLVPAAPEQVKIAQRGPFVTLEWTAPVRNRDGSEDIQLEAAEVLRRVMEIPPPPPPPPPPAPAVESSLEPVEGPSLPEPTEEAAPAKEPVEGERRPREETASPVQPETEEPEATPSKEKLAEPSEQAGEESTESETTSQTTPSVVAPAEQAPPPPPPFAQEATVIATVESIQGGEVLTFRDPWDPEWEGKRVQYAVRYINRKGRTGVQSPVKKIDPLPPIDPPRGVTTEIEEGLVRLRWIQEEPAEEEEFLTLFNIYRRSGADLYPREPLNGEPLEETLFEDRTATYGQEYCYAVRSVAIPPEPEIAEAADPLEATTEEVEEEPATEEVGVAETVSDKAATEEATEPSAGETEELVSEEAGVAAADQTVPEAPAPQSAPVSVEKPLIESVDSEEVCLTPKDTYPPPAPGNLFAVEVSDGILLSWDDVPALDLGGYLVYRSEDDDGPFELVTKQPVPLASYTDRTTEPGVVYYYTVRAVDRAEPWNESPRSRVASARSEERP